MKSNQNVIVNLAKKKKKKNTFIEYEREILKCTFETEITEILIILINKL